MPSPPSDSRAKAEAQIVARAGHDMRQPLHALALFHAALKRRAGDEQTQAIVARAEQAGAALSRVMLGVFALAQLNAGSDAAPLAAIRLEDLFGALREELAPDFETSGAALALEGGGAATTEPEGLKAILRPLLLLAAESAGPVRLAGSGDAAPVIELSWRAPLAEDAAALLAGDFARAAASPRTARNGLDLALLVAARQAEALRIVIEPTPDGGQTRLRLLLPAA